MSPTGKWIKWGQTDWLINLAKATFPTNTTPTVACPAMRLYTATAYDEEEEKDLADT